MRYIIGASVSLTGRARIALIAILSLFQYPYPVMATPNRANAQTYWPPLNTEPRASRRAKMPLNRSVVFSPF